VKKLRMYVTSLTVRDLAELEPAGNTTDVAIFCDNNKGLSLQKVLPVLRRWHLCRLTISDFSGKPVPPFKVLGNFIRGKKSLSYLHIVPSHGDDSRLETMRDQVNELILPRRPNFKFDISRI
jgi:hypothetical protein